MATLGTVSCPIFLVKVIKKEGSRLWLRIDGDGDQSFDIHDPRDVIKVFAYGGDFLLPDGRSDYGREETSVLARQIDFHTQLWNDDWIRENAYRYYRDVKVLSEVRAGTSAVPTLEAIHGRVDADRHFECETHPHCVVEIVVTDPSSIAHLSDGLVYSFY